MQVPFAFEKDLQSVFSAGVLEKTQVYGKI